jgi:hypothetical protein
LGHHFDAAIELCLLRLIASHSGINDYASPSRLAMISSNKRQVQGPDVACASRHNMHANLRDLADIDRRLAEAVTQLRAQQELVADMNCESHGREVSLRLLSNMLRQFRALVGERAVVVQCIATFKREAEIPTFAS